MKKLKMALLTAAFVTAITAAFAFNKTYDDPCASATLYYFDGTNYQPLAGVSGSCNTTFMESCHYYNNGVSYVPCTAPGEPAGRFIKH